MKAFTVDASMVKADANHQCGVHRSESLPPNAANRAMRERLSVPDNAAFGAATPAVPKFTLAGPLGVTMD